MLGITVELEYKVSEESVVEGSDGHVKNLDDGRWRDLFHVVDFTVPDPVVIADWYLDTIGAS